MKALILEFAETPDFKNLDYSIIEYSKKHNLSVMKDTEIPAISFVNMDTETFTKTFNEPSDSDNNVSYQLKKLLDTRTETFTSTETSDGDKNYYSLKMLMDTKTLTESVESTDSDK